MNPETVSVPTRAGGLLIVEDDGENDHVENPIDRLQVSERYIECARPVEARQ